MSMWRYQFSPFLCLLLFILGRVSLALVPLSRRLGTQQIGESPKPKIARRTVRSTNFFMHEDNECVDEPSQEQEGGSIDGTPEPAEDPEVTSLREEIASLESELKGRKSSLAYALEQVEEYSKAGYARQVAEMENMRRVRSNMNSSNKSNAMAGVLRNFLPIYDTLDKLKESYAIDEFGSKYGGLTLGPTFAKMGVKEFSVAVGEPLDLIRVKVVGSEYSDASKGTVIAQVAHGMELEGNVIRAAGCITSLGSEGAPNAPDEGTGAGESPGAE